MSAENHRLHRVEFRKMGLEDLPGFRPLLALQLLLPLVVLAWFSGRRGMQAGEFFARVGHSLFATPAKTAETILLGLGLVVGLVFLRLQKNERLVLSERGIEYRSPMQGHWRWLQGVMPDWSLEWPSITAIRLVLRGRSSQAEAYQLEVLGGQRPRMLAPLAWIAVVPGARPVRRPLWHRLRENRAVLDKLVKDSALIVALTLRGFEFGPIESRHVFAGFDLARHAGTRALLMAMAGLVIYAAADWSWMPWDYAGPWPWRWFAVIAVAAGALAFRVARGVPRVERAGVAAFFVLAACVAGVPGLMRINEATAVSPPAVHRYARTGIGSYRPRDSLDLPPLEFSAQTYYWSQFPPGSTYDFVLLRGELDFYQFDMQRVRADQRDFYNDRNLWKTRHH